MSFKIRTKLMGAFLVMLIPLAVLIGINRYNQRVIHLATHKVEDIHKEISSLSDLQIALNMLIMPPNDYLITGDISEKVEFNHIITEIEGHLLNISTTMRCNRCHEITDEMVKKLYRVEPKNFWSEEMASVKGIMDGLQIVKEKGEKIFKIEKPLGSTEGVVLMKEMDAMARNLIREDILKHKKKDEKELISAIKDSERVWRMSWFMMIGGFALSVSMGLFFAFFYSGFFVRPIEKLHHGADAIAGGDFKSRVDVKTGDELEQLASGMNEMAEKLDNFYGTLEDQVKERTRELQESEKRFRQLFNSSSDAVFVHGITPDGKPGNFIEVNDISCDRLGYTRDELLKMSPVSIDDPEMAKQQAGVIKDFITKKNVMFEMVHIAKDGRKIPVEINASFFELNKQPFVLSVARDITERKKTEALFHALAVSNIGAEFFHETVSSLCTWIGVECVIVGELVDEGRVRALAMQLDGKAVEHYEYALAGTPCESATQKGYCEYHEGVIQLFPEDKDLVGIGAEAYVGTPIRDKNGKINGILCAISRHKFVPPPMVKEVFAIIAARAGVEIERKKIEEALKESEEWFRTVTNTAGDAIIGLEEPGNIHLWNKKAEEIFGYPADDVMGKDLHDLIVPEKYREKAREGLKGFFQTGTGPVVGKTVELTALRKDGTEFPIALSISAMKIQEKWQATGIIRDITERKRMDEELQLTHFALNHAVDSVFFMEPSGKFLYVNETACRVLGYPKEELLSMSVADIDPNLPDGVPLEMSQATKKAGIARVESEHKTKDGRLIPVEVIVAYLQYKGEDYHCSFVRDITERKKAEEKIKEQLDYLERFQKVAVKREFRIKDLRDENDRLKARIEEMEKKFKS